MGGDLRRQPVTGGSGFHTGGFGAVSAASLGGGTPLRACDKGESVALPLSVSLSLSLQWSRNGAGVLPTAQPQAGGTLLEQSPYCRFALPPSLASSALIRPRRDRAAVHHL